MGLEMPPRPTNTRKDVYFFQASPGVGKTRLLRELFGKQFPPDKEYLKDEIFFIVADFNRQACQVETACGNFSDAQLFVMLRLYYVEFVHQNFQYWKSFLRKFYNQFPRMIPRFSSSIKSSGRGFRILPARELSS
jgi:hypothetical protein